MSLLINVLIVDDHKNFLSMIKAVLEFSDFKVRAVESAEKALDIIRNEPPDIILTDLMMPGMDGIELALMAKDVAPGVPVVMITAAATSAIEPLATSIGIVKVLDKCISPADIGRCLQEEVHKRKKFKDAHTVEREGLINMSSNIVISDR